MPIPENTKKWAIGITLRSALLKAIEGKREINIIKHSLEARIVMYLDHNSPHYESIKIFFDLIEQSNQKIESFLREFIVVSQFQLVSSMDGLAKSSMLEGIYIGVEHAQGEKCPRCWQWDITEHEYKLCKRCQIILKISYLFILHNLYNSFTSEYFFYLIYYFFDIH